MSHYTQSKRDEILDPIWINCSSATKIQMDIRPQTKSQTLEEEIQDRINNFCDRVEIQDQILSSMVENIEAILEDMKKLVTDSDFTNLYTIDDDTVSTDMDFSIVDKTIVEFPTKIELFLAFMTNAETDIYVQHAFPMGEKNFLARHKNFIEFLEFKELSYFFTNMVGYHFRLGL